MFHKSLTLICLLALLASGADRRAQLMNQKAPAVTGSSCPANQIISWHGDESSGNMADSVGTSTLVNQSSVGFGAGIINNAPQFVSASFDYFNVADNADVSFGAGIKKSFSFWIHLTAAPNYQYPFAKDAGAAEEYYARLYGGGDNKLHFFGFDSGGTGQEAISNETFANGQTYHVVITFDGTNCKIYVNNNTPSSTAFNDIRDSNGAFELGYNTAVGGGLDGWVDEFQVYSRALTSTEVSTLYNAGAAKACP